MTDERDFVPPQRPPPVPRKDVLTFHPWRALIGGVVGLLAGMVLVAATAQGLWLLLAPGAALLLAFDFWWWLFDDPEDQPLKPPIWWSKQPGGDE